MVRQSDLWATPPSLVEWVRNLAGWGRFDFDPCAEPATAKADRYITPTTGDGLSDPWLGSTIWLNPPYSRQSLWLARAAEEGRTKRVAALVMPSFDAAYWRPFVWESAQEVWMLQGRIAFLRNGVPCPGSNVRSCVIIYDPTAQTNHPLKPANPRVRLLKPDY